jgi:hypothetical protein
MAAMSDVRKVSLAFDDDEEDGHDVEVDILLDVDIDENTAATAMELAEELIRAARGERFTGRFVRADGSVSLVLRGAEYAPNGGERLQRG